MEFPYNYDDLPNKDQLDAYVRDAVPVGSFLMNIICNNLTGAVKLADSRNLPMIPTYVNYLYNEAPSSCWGSPQKYRDWLEKGGVK